MRLRKILAAALSLAIICGAPPCLRGSSITALGSGQASIPNPFNKQNDEEVLYDGKSWVQPVEWNVPTINTREYNGSIMLFFDKISFDPENVRGKTQRVYFSLRGIKDEVSMVRFHIFYDTRLKVKAGSNGEVAAAGKAVKGFDTGSVMVEEGQLEFYAYSNDKALVDGSLFTIDFIIPENAEQGELYPIGIVFVKDDVGNDLFIDRAQSEAGRLQMAYVFQKGIYNGWIKMNGEKPKPALMLGDPNNDGKVDAKDATFVLGEYALRSTGAEAEPLPPEIETAADVNKDGFIDAKDASSILAYYSYISTGGTGTMEDFLGYAK